MWILIFILSTVGLISKTWSRDQVQLPLITPWSGALIIIKVVGPFCQRHNYKNPVEEGTQTNVLLRPHLRGYRSDHEGRCTEGWPLSPPSLRLIAGRHCTALQRRSSPTPTTFILYFHSQWLVSLLSPSSLSSSCIQQPLFYPIEKKVPTQSIPRDPKGSNRKVCSW